MVYVDKLKKCDKFLKVATVHMDVVYGNPKKNFDILAWLCRSAAALGAKIICAPEMCLTGYVYEDLASIGQLAETENSEAMETLRQLAMECQAFLVVGMAEKVSQTGSLFNSAFAFSPSGKLVGHYRKVNAESRWACPGQPLQDNVFLTPWGGVGLLICSDSYNGLLPRVTALKGASMIAVPTNWPETESGFPEALFRVRALENGVWLLAANRGGQEERLDFSRAKSYLIDPGGQVVKGSSSGVDRRVRAYDVPLDSMGLIEERRVKCMASRLPGEYHRVYSDISRIENLTGYLGLPGPGYLDVHAMAPGKANPLDFLEKFIDTMRPGSLALLPQANYSEEDQRKINFLGKKNQVGIFTAKTGLDTRFVVSRSAESPAKSNLGQWPVYDFGPARLMLADIRSLWHPELAVSASKEGVDLILCPAPELTREDALMLAFRPIEQVAVAAASPQVALVSLIPQGHGIGRGVSAIPGQVATYTVDTALTRKKSFQDRVDFEAIFKPPVLSCPLLNAHP
ncbi:MAG: carbon-nitrogen hydrolase family protein [Deltaproteobacteria bacterium]|jgi:predicted amidohydrolase|nr:carbon-nitrogen hydrolase family protein [Deltaproteobacteria bacterium]